MDELAYIAEGQEPLPDEGPIHHPDGCIGIQYWFALLRWLW